MNGEHVKGLSLGSLAVQPPYSEGQQQATALYESCCAANSKVISY